MRKLTLTSLLTLALAASTTTFAHGGGKDANSCHVNRKAGEYHCHGGPLNGEAFVSREEAEAELERRRSEGESEDGGEE